MRIPTSVRLSLLPIALLAIALPACGGGETRPGPLKYTIDEMFIAKVPLEQKQTVLQRQNDFAASKMRRAETEAEYNESATELSIARNELEQARLAEQSVKAKQEAAEASGDMNRVNAAAREMRAAKLATQAAVQKVKYMESRRNFLKKKVLQAEDEVYAQEARFELAKARVAKTNNIRPKGFDPANFERQSTTRSQQAQRSKTTLDRDQAVVDKARLEWQNLQKEAARAKTGAS